MSKYTKIIENNNRNSQLLEKNTKNLIIQLFGAGDFDNVFVLFVISITVISNLINPKIDYLASDFKPRKKFYNYIGNHPITLLCNDDNISNFCKSFGYKKLNNVYEILLSNNDKILSLINDIKILYMNFGNDINKLSIKLVWDDNKNRLVLS